MQIMQTIDNGWGENKTETWAHTIINKLLEGHAQV